MPAAQCAWQPVIRQAAAPLAALDRDSALVSVEGYGPDIVVVTTADKAEVLTSPGYGIPPQGAGIRSTATKQAISCFRVYPGRDGDFALCEDDGVSFNYECGNGAVTTNQHWNDATSMLTAAAGGDRNRAKAASGNVEVGAP